MIYTTTQEVTMSQRYATHWIPEMFLNQAENLPEDINITLPEITDAALDACMKVIADRFAGFGFPVTGDFSPDEVSLMADLVEAFARRMALNNTQIWDLNDPETAEIN